MGEARSGLYIGLISGTSMDGIDAALLRFDQDSFALLATSAKAYAEPLREQLELAKVAPETLILDAIGELDRKVGHAFADATLQLLESAGIAAVDVTAIGSHGQTLRHRTDRIPAFSIQIGDPNTISVETGIVTVADFRRRDIALGGEGAPLAPAFHDWLLTPRQHDYAVVNLGGIANLTFLGENGAVTGFDTGPANTLLDAWMLANAGAAFDADGAYAARGGVDELLLRRLMDDEYFSRPGPKSTGFEHFNLRWLNERAADLLADAGLEDVLATLTELSARTIATAVADLGPGIDCVYVCGGGARNPELMRRLELQLGTLRLDTTSTIGIDPDWVEAALFAWLAWRTLAGETGTIAAVTGASRASIAGAIYPI